VRLLRLIGERQEMGYDGEQDENLREFNQWSLDNLLR
jgi:hypothetical protein